MQQSVQSPIEHISIYTDYRDMSGPFSENVHQGETGHGHIVAEQQGGRQRV